MHRTLPTIIPNGLQLLTYIAASLRYLDCSFYATIQESNFPSISIAVSLIYPTNYPLIL
jgi:hypothetical protein